MCKREERVMVTAPVRQKEHKDEELLPLEALKALDRPVSEMLKPREIPGRWKVG